MQLTPRHSQLILQAATSCLGHPYTDEFTCMHLARLAYQAAGLDIPLIQTKIPLPANLQLTSAELLSAPLGHTIFLRDRYDPRTDRTWTHVVLAAPHGHCIHTSLFYGRKVVLSSLVDIMRDRYDLAASHVGASLSNP